MSTAHFLLHGQAAPPPAPLALRAGPLTLLYEPANGFVRRICLGKCEVLRGIYAAVRDHNWGTVPPQISNLQSQISNEAFTLTFDVTCRQGDLHFDWHGRIQGQSDGTLRYDFDGQAKTAFLRNRIGFCVLHPIRECAGAAARQTHTDGRTVACRFPDLIEPQIFGQSSFRDLRAVAHEVAPGLWAEVELEGDMFEMEDQRNWTDASFKTYCTPLAVPFPVEVAAGTRIHQNVTLRLTGAMGSAATSPVELGDASPAPITLTVPETPSMAVPKIGLGAASHSEALTESEIARLRSLHLAHVRLDLRLSAPDWPATWQRVAREAEHLGVGLELALYLPRSGEPDLANLRRRLQTSAAPIVRVLALREGESATTPPTLAVVRQATAALDVPVGAGSDANFCELNREQAREQFPLADADFVFWSINPQVHAFDHRSLVETLEAQPDTLKTARAFAGGQPLVVTPVTLKQRFNPVATGGPPPVPPGELPPPVDPRQLSLFGAAWTLGCLVALAGAGAESVTLYETTGWRGVMERAAGSPVPEQFPSPPGAVFPLYHVFADVAGCTGGAPVSGTGSGRIVALTIFRQDTRPVVLLANLTAESQPVRVLLATPAAMVRALDAASAAAATVHPEEFRSQNGECRPLSNGQLDFRLRPYALARIEPVI